MKVASVGQVMPGPLGPGERKVCVEVLAVGQSLVADALHPDTLEPYRWLDQHPLDVPFADLPPIDEQTARDIIEEAEAVLREAGAVDIKLQREEKPRRESKSNGSDFFNRLNDWALRERECWVKQIFPQAKKQGNGAWRVPAVLRGLPASKQDISIHESGIRDFHEDRTMSPIDFIIQFGHGVYRGAAREAGCVQVKPENEDLFDCAFWLCRQLGISPADLGWRDREGPPPYEEVPRARQAARTTAAGERPGGAGRRSPGNPGRRRVSPSGGRQGVRCVKDRAGAAVRP